MDGSCPIRVRFPPLHLHSPDTVSGTSCGDKDAAAARTIHPIPPACGIYYYEVEILGKEHKR
jgi:hypothetical protein